MSRRVQSARLPAVAAAKRVEPRGAAAADDIDVLDFVEQMRAADEAAAAPLGSTTRRKLAGSSLRNVLQASRMEAAAAAASSSAATSPSTPLSDSGGLLGASAASTARTGSRDSVRLAPLPGLGGPPAPAAFAGSGAGGVPRIQLGSLAGTRGGDFGSSRSLPPLQDLVSTTGTGAVGRRHRASLEPLGGTLLSTSPLEQIAAGLGRGTPLHLVDDSEKETAGGTAAAASAAVAAAFRGAGSPPSPLHHAPPASKSKLMRPTSSPALVRRSDASAAAGGRGAPPPPPAASEPSRSTLTTPRKGVSTAAGSPRTPATGTPGGRRPQAVTTRSAAATPAAGPAGSTPSRRGRALAVPDAQAAMDPLSPARGFSPIRASAVAAAAVGVASPARSLRRTAEGGVSGSNLLDSGFQPLSFPLRSGSPAPAVPADVADIRQQLQPSPIEGIGFDAAAASARHTAVATPPPLVGSASDGVLDAPLSPLTPLQQTGRPTSPATFIAAATAAADAIPQSQFGSRGSSAPAAPAGGGSSGARSGAQAPSSSSPIAYLSPPTARPAAQHGAAVLHSDDGAGATSHDDGAGATSHDDGGSAMESMDPALRAWLQNAFLQWRSAQPPAADSSVDDAALVMQFVHEMLSGGSGFDMLFDEAVPFDGVAAATAADALPSGPAAAAGLYGTHGTLAQQHAMPAAAAEASFASGSYFQLRPDERRRLLIDIAVGRVPPRVLMFPSMPPLQQALSARKPDLMAATGVGRAPDARGSETRRAGSPPGGGRTTTNRVDALSSSGIGTRTLADLGASISMSASFVAKPSLADSVALPQPYARAGAGGGPLDISRLSEVDHSGHADSADDSEGAADRPRLLDTSMRRSQVGGVLVAPSSTQRPPLVAAPPILPTGRLLIFVLASNWGDPHYVGLNGVEVFDAEGLPIALDEHSVWVSTDEEAHDAADGTADAHAVGTAAGNLVNGINMTSSAAAAWMTRRPADGAPVNVVVDLGMETTLSMVRIWNYNAGRIHSYRGARHVLVFLDGQPLFDGELGRAPGHLPAFESSISLSMSEMPSAMVMASLCSECILLTADVLTLARIAEHDPNGLACGYLDEGTRALQPHVLPSPGVSAFLVPGGTTAANQSAAAGAAADQSTMQQLRPRVLDFGDAPARNSRADVSAGEPPDLPQLDVSGAADRTFDDTFYPHRASDGGAAGAASGSGRGDATMYASFMASTQRPAGGALFRLAEEGSEDGDADASGDGGNGGALGRTFGGGAFGGATVFGATASASFDDEAVLASRDTLWYRGIIGRAEACGIYTRCSSVTLRVLSNHGDSLSVGLGNIIVLAYDEDAQRVGELQGVAALVRVIGAVGSGGDGADAASFQLVPQLTDGCTLTTDPDRMWRAHLPVPPGSNHVLLDVSGLRGESGSQMHDAAIVEIVLDLDGEHDVAGVVLHNYNASPDSATCGIRQLQVDVDGQPLLTAASGGADDSLLADRSSFAGTVSAQRGRPVPALWTVPAAPGHGLADFGHAILFAEPPQAVATTVSQGAALDAVDAPTGSAVMVALPNTFPDPPPAVALFGADGNEIPLSDANVVAFPSAAQSATIDVTGKSQRAPRLPHTGSFVSVTFQSPQAVTRVVLTRTAAATAEPVVAEVSVDGQLVAAGTGDVMGGVQSLPLHVAFSPPRAALASPAADGLRASGAA